MLKHVYDIGYRFYMVGDECTSPFCCRKRLLYQLYQSMPQLKNDLCKMSKSQMNEWKVKLLAYLLLSTNCLHQNQPRCELNSRHFLLNITYLPNWLLTNENKEKEAGKWLFKKRKVKVVKPTQIQKYWVQNKPIIQWKLWE